MSMGAYLTAGLGRMMLSLIFIVLGIASLFNWEDTEADFVSVLSNWELYAGNMDEAGNLFPLLIASVRIWAILGIIFQLLGGILVFFGIQVRMGALLLLLHLIPVTILYHHFWFLDGQAMNRSLVLFLKNLSIIGGLFILLALGRGQIRERAPRGEKSCDKPKK